MAFSTLHERLVDVTADCSGCLAGTDSRKYCSCQCTGRSGSLSCLLRHCDSAPLIVDVVVSFYEAQVAAIADIFSLMVSLNAAVLTMEDAWVIRDSPHSFRCL